MNRLTIFVKDILNSEVFRNTSILVSGTVLAQLIPILLQPLLRRLFPPEAFGAYAVYLSVVGILVIISSFKYDLAIVLPKDDRGSINIIGLTLLISFLLCLAFFIFIFLKFDHIQNFLNIPSKYAVSIYFIPIGVFLMTANQNYNYFLVKKKAFLSSSINKFSRRGSEGISQVGFGFSQAVNGLVVSDIIGNIVNSVVSVYQSLKHGFDFRYINLKEISLCAKEYQEYPKFNLIPGLMSAFSFFLPVIIINRMFSPETAGYFDLTRQLLLIPLALVSISLSNVLLQLISNRFILKQSLLNDLKPIFLVILTIAFFEIIIIELFGITLFKFLFGSNWALSGEISKVLVVSFSLNFIVSSFTGIFIGLRKIKVYSYWQVMYFIAILSLFFIKNLSFLEFIYIYVFIESVCYIVLIFLIIHITKEYELQIKKIE